MGACAGRAEDEKAGRHPLRLGRDELEALFAHEVAHLVRGDIRHPGVDSVVPPVRIGSVGLYVAFACYGYG